MHQIAWPISKFVDQKTVIVTKSFLLFWTKEPRTLQRIRKLRDKMQKTIGHTGNYFVDKVSTPLLENKDEHGSKMLWIT